MPTLILTEAYNSDNEYPEGDWGEGGAQYMEQLKEEYHNSEIVVPLTYNDPGPRKTFVNGTVGIVRHFGAFIINVWASGIR
jgi:hypothetical protein